MAEPITGTILLAASEKRNFAVYHLIFTDTRILAIEAAIADTNNPIQSAFAGHPVLGALAQAAAMNAMSGGNVHVGQANMARMQGMQRWIGIKASSSGKPIIDYKQKVVTDEMLSVGNVSIPYQAVKRVVLKKELGQPDYYLSFGEGVFSSETFIIQGDAVDAVVDLIKKTPLAPKLKQ